MNTRLNTLYIVSLFFLMIVSLVPTSSSEPSVVQGDEVVIYALPYDFDEYSTFAASSYPSAQWTSAVYASLVKRSSANNRGWIADIAADMPSVSSDGLSFTFSLKDNLYFSNGDPLTVEDVEFSLKVAVTAKINVAGFSTYAGFLDNDSMMVISSSTFVITILQSYAFPYDLMSFDLVPEEYFGQRYKNCLQGVGVDCTWNAEDGADSVSAGPFKVSDIDNTNEIVTLVANPYWYDADKVRTDKIIYQKIAEKTAAISALADGSIHIMDSQFIPGLNEFSSLDGITEVFIGDPQTQEISLNHKHPFFGTGEMIPGNDAVSDENKIEDAKKLRTAMSHVVDRETYVNEILEGLAIPAATSMPSSSLGWDSSIHPQEFNITKARELMTEAGFDFSTLGTPNANNKYEDYFFELTVLSPNTNPARNLWSADYVEQLPKIGIGVVDHISTGWAEIIPRTFGSSVDPGLYTDGGYDIFFVGYSWTLDWNPAGLFDASGSCSTGSCSNFYNFDLEEKITPFATAISDYLTELDFDARLEKVKYVQELMHEWLPVLPIHYSQSHWAWSSDVNGIDSLLISTSSQEWDQVSRIGFKLNEKLDGGKTTSTEESTPVLNYAIIAGLLASIIGVFITNRPKRR